MGIYPPANDVCQDAAFLFKDRPELILWVYGDVRMSGILSLFTYVEGRKTGHVMSLHVFLWL